jgi:lipopolysaccharide biosynthesis glycosyltransferase
MERINVVVTIDNKFTMLCGVTLISLLENCSKPTQVDVYVISGKGKLSDENKQKLVECVKPRGARIFFKDFVLSDFMEPNIKTYYSEAICYRIFAPRLLKGVKRFLYLDSDMFVVGDICDIFFRDFGNNYIAAVEDQGEKIKPGFKSHYKKVVGDNKYFNSGLLIVDCVKWRKLGAEKKMIDYINSGNLILLDQDALNKIFVGKVLFLEPKWDFFFNNLILNVWHFFDNPKGLGIIHYQSPYKPFSSPRITRYEFAYMKYLALSPWKHLIPQRLLIKLLHPFFCLYLFVKWGLLTKIKKK